MRIIIDIFDAEVVATMIKATDLNNDVLLKEVGKSLCSIVKELFDDSMGKDRVNITLELDKEDK